MAWKLAVSGVIRTTTHILGLHYYYIDITMKHTSPPLVSISAPELSSEATLTTSPASLARHSILFYMHTHYTLQDPGKCVGLEVIITCTSFNKTNTVEPFNKGHLGTEGFVPYSEVVLYWEVFYKQPCIALYWFFTSCLHEITLP